MYPFSVKFKIEVEKASEEMTVNNLIEYLQERMKIENIQFTSKPEKLEYASSKRFKLFNLMTIFDKGYIKVEQIGEKNFKIIHGITLLPILTLNILFTLVLIYVTKQWYPIIVFLVVVLIDT
jgi:hypothetical protein